MSPPHARLLPLFFVSSTLWLATGCTGPLTEPFIERGGRAEVKTPAGEGQTPATGAAAREVVLLDFTATWCGPCQTMKPTIHSLERAGYAVRVVDVDREPELANQFQVSTIPTYVLLVDGQEAARMRGIVSQTQLERLFREHQGE